MVKDNKKERNNDVAIKRKEKQFKRVSSRLVETRVREIFCYENSN